MKLKIISPQKIVFEWEVLEAVVPTQWWEITILPNHTPLVTITKWGLCKFKTEQSIEDLLSDEGFYVVAIWDWTLYTDGKNILMTVYSADTTTDLSEEQLEEEKKKLQEEIERLKAKWSIEELEKAFINMNKILADIKLANIKKRKWK